MVKVSKAKIQSKARKRLSDRNRRAVFVEFPIALDSRLEAAATRLGLTKSDIVRDATEEALNALDTMPAQ